MITVTHIVPLFAPVIDGVGDYALNLARTLRVNHEIDSRFVVCDPTWKGPARFDDFGIRGPEPFGDRGLNQALRDASQVILHYVGYAYHPKGIPRWLIETLAEWKRNDPGVTLITVFHEIWSAGPPWKSVFFLQPTQRKLVAQLLDLSRHSFVSTRAAFEKLNAMAKSRVTLLPVSANILSTREPTPHPRGSELYQPLIFGQPWTRALAVKKHAELLRALQSQRLLERVLVMGHGAQSDPPSEDVVLLRSMLPKERVSVQGELPAMEASDIFDRADFLLCPTPASDLCKSSSAMSAFACGCPVVVAPWINNGSPDPLQPHHFLTVGDTDCELRNVTSLALRKWNLQRVAAQARAWFFENAAWPIVAAKFAQILAQTARIAVDK
jgi:glycosyltransferase involved in cell wall biosynthesis